MSAETREREYGRPPLVEAVFELFSEGTPGFRTDRFFGQFDEYVSAPEHWGEHVVAVELRDGRLVASQASPQQGERRWNSQRNHGVLVGPGVFACNILPPYKHFADYRSVLKRLLQAYIEVARPSALQWIGHRYINRIKVTGAPADLIAIYPRLPGSLASNHPPLSLQLEASKFEAGTVVASLALEEHTGGEASYVLDLYARSSIPLQNWGVDEMILWHDRAHLAVREAFEMAITETARTLFKERK